MESGRPPAVSILQRLTSLFHKLATDLDRFVNAVFDRSACQMVRWRLSSPSIEERIDSILRSQIISDAERIAPAVARRLEDQLLDICREVVRYDVERRIASQPLDAVIRNRVEDELAPQIAPRVERAMRDTEHRLDTIFKAALRDVVDARFSEDQLFALYAQAVDKQVAANPPNVRKKKSANRPAHVRKTRERHSQFPAIMKNITSYQSKNAGYPNILMVGPAGSGKTTIAEDLAAELQWPFYFNGPVQSEYKLTGYKDAGGTYHATAFRLAFENGGVYLFDEFDACAPQALVAFNTALSNGVFDFPDRIVEKHPKCICIAAANTFGRGANRLYVGRNQLDAATLDRFVVHEIGYCDTLERTEAVRLGGAMPNQRERSEKWVSQVQKWRSRLEVLGERHVISMRASIAGAILLSDFSAAEVESMVVWRGLDQAIVKKIRG